MSNRPLQVEIEPEFVERFETLRIALDIDSMRPVIRALRWKVLLSGIGFFVASLLLMAWALTLFGVPLRSPMYAIFLTTMLIWMFSWIYRYFLMTGVANALTKFVFEMTRGQAGPGIEGFESIELTDEAFFLNTQSSSSLCRWPCIWQIKRETNWTHIQLIDRRWVMIPERVFDSAEDYQWFVDEIERRNNDAGGVDGIITEHLKEYTLACPKCRYPLHQIPQARCPECGREIEFDDFRSSTSELAAEADD